MQRDATRRLWLPIVAVMLVAGCAAGGYPLHVGQGASQFNPGTVGVPTRAVVTYVDVHPGDRIELVGAEAIGTLDGAQVTMRLSRPVIDDEGDHVIGTATEPLEGAVLTAATASPGFDNMVGLVAEMTPQRPGRFEVTNVRLRYRLNGGAERAGEAINTVWTVCADVVAPADCPEASEAPEG
jgi:hypothetical protein